MLFFLFLSFISVFLVRLDNQRHTYFKVLKKLEGGFILMIITAFKNHGQVLSYQSIIINILIF